VYKLRQDSFQERLINQSLTPITTKRCTNLDKRILSGSDWSTFLYLLDKEELIHFFHRCHSLHLCGSNKNHQSHTYCTNLVMIILGDRNSCWWFLETRLINQFISQPSWLTQLWSELELWITSSLHIVGYDNCWSGGIYYAPIRDETHQSVYFTADMTYTIGMVLPCSFIYHILFLRMHHQYIIYVYYILPPRTDVGLTSRNNLFLVLLGQKSSRTRGHTFLYSPEIRGCDFWQRY